MIPRVIQSKFLIVFVSAFLCLNLSGSFCLAYCQVKTIETEREHCPLAKTNDDHCSRAKSGTQINAPSFENSIGESAVDCCLPALNFFVGKLEKNQFPVHTAIAKSEDFSFAQHESFEKIEYASNFSYQKPLLDHRAARLKNCVFRI